MMIERCENLVEKQSILNFFIYYNYNANNDETFSSEYIMYSIKYAQNSTFKRSKMIGVICMISI